VVLYPIRITVAHVCTGQRLIAGIPIDNRCERRVHPRHNSLVFVVRLWWHDKHSFPNFIALFHIRIFPFRADTLFDNRIVNHHRHCRALVKNRRLTPPRSPNHYYFFGSSFKLVRNSTTSRSSRRESFLCKSSGIALGPVRRRTTSATGTTISLFSAV